MHERFLQKNEDDKEILVAFIVRTTERKWRVTEKEVSSKAGTIIYVHRCPAHKRLRIVEIPFSRTEEGEKNGDCYANKSL